MSLLIKSDNTNEHRFFLSGHINEDSDFSSLKELNADSIILNFKDILSINSCGIREWTIALKQIKATTIKYEQCPTFIIDQINMIVDFIKKGVEITSFYAPYFCEHCDEEVNVLLKPHDIKQRKAPIAKHDVCDNELEFDSLENQFFRFIK
ncbi:MAG: hypothetical protein N4A33_03115 [Bacteriovoracaceae bacterium]|jgi:hypothetical protein|nr:hypothetical protein [Bacteriovoracaceae bacterium]